MPEPTISAPQKPPNPVRVWFKQNAKAFWLFTGIILLALASRTCSTAQKANRTALDRSKPSVASQAQDDIAQQIRDLQAQLQAERDKNAQSQASGLRGNGQHVAPCTKAQLNQFRQDQYGGQLVCVEESSGDWWEQAQPFAYADPSLTAAQIAQMRAQNASTPPGASNIQGGNVSSATAAPAAKKAPDLAVSFRDETSAAPPKVDEKQPSEEKVAEKLSEPKPSEEKPVSASAPETKRDPELTMATGPKYRVREGTLLPCTEMLRINGAANGHINCLISVPVYSTSGEHLLIPQYSLALGRVEAVSTQNQERLFVAFDRMVMPDGYTVDLSNFDGLDQIGQIGLKDKVDRHLLRIFGTSLAIAAIGGLAQIGNGAAITPFGEYRTGVTQSVSQSSMQVLNRMLDTMPTLVIREGARNQIYTLRDVYLEDFKNHHMKGDM